MKRQPRHYFLVGISGSSMSGLKKLLEGKGFLVSGSDLQLKGHSAANITPDIDLVVATQAALSPQAPAYVEIEAARRLNIPVVSRAQALNMVARGHLTIAIAGTHGKTTTATLVARLLEELGEDPLANIGGEVAEWGSGSRVGSGKYFVVEACEYEKQFLHFEPFAAVLTNIEYEHFDTYSSFSLLLRTFEEFVRKIPKEGRLIVCAESKEALLVSKESRALTKSYGFSRLADYQIEILPKPKEGGEAFCLNDYSFQTLLEGKANILNCAGALALLIELGFARERLQEALLAIKPPKRRLDFLGEKRAVLYYDDYGHHPTEIKASLSALRRKYPKRRIILVFEPHQGVRTLKLYKEFAAILKEADELLVLPVFAVAGRDIGREKMLGLSKKIASLASGQSVADYEEAGSLLRKLARPGDIILTMGATTVYKIAQKLLRDKDE